MFAKEACGEGVQEKLFDQHCSTDRITHLYCGRKGAPMVLISEELRRKASAMCNVFALYSSNPNPDFSVGPIV